MDVLILGCGAAGVAAALAARRAGAEVAMIEHQAEDRHTPNTRMSGGWLMTLTDEVAGRGYLTECAQGLVEDDLIAGWARGAVSLPTELKALGVDLELADTATWGLSRLDVEKDSWAEHAEIPGADSVRVWRTVTDLPSTCPAAGGLATATGTVLGGEALYRGLMHAVRAAGVEVRWGIEPISLILRQTADGTTVAGIRWLEGGTVRELRARGGVILATGGFGAGRDLIREFLSVPNTRFYGNPGNDGSGLKLAMSAGAALARMNRMVGRGVMSFPLADGVELGFMVIMKGGGYVICDDQGARYADEYDQAMQQHSFFHHMQHVDPHTHRYSRSPSFYVFDERRRQSGPLTYQDRGACGVGLYDWSSDNQREIDAGWISVGPTPAAAAAAAGAGSPEAFEAAIAEYNRGCQAGSDSFGRPADTLIALDQPPYYCVPLYIGGPYVTGGPQRNAEGQVLGVRGGPVPGLFSGGELGQAIGLLYPAQGASISEAWCSGAIAGASAARAAGDSRR
ncbi:FAD-dependent oxidoreductase [Sporichthya sp.]|uniref:FAD-dependent oxidoreductase n=1 Tax=Sporichthya sp. TaxID=65475 RepID=UPI0025D75A01|nr:FAD-dependent oxidoreductase [Sporichthya sp.]